MNVVASSPATPSIDPAEIEKFSGMAADWWDPNGKFKPLHKFNPVRLSYIRDQLCAHFAKDPKALKPFKGLSILDIGCGGGLLCEPLTRLGATVTGVDATEKNVKTAASHAASQGLDITYRHGTAEQVLAEGRSFDLVLNMEVVEHVADVRQFMTDCAALVAPGGMMIVATLNRTPKAYMLAIVGAEYVLGWLPKGTHQFEKFVKPEELRAPLTAAGMRVDHETGVAFNPLTDRWSLSRDMGVNYMMTALKPGIV